MILALMHDKLARKRLRNSFYNEVEKKNYFNKSKGKVTSKQRE